MSECLVGVAAMICEIHHWLKMEIIKQIGWNSQTKKTDEREKHAIETAVVTSHTFDVSHFVFHVQIECLRIVDWCVRADDFSYTWNEWNGKMYIFLWTIYARAVGIAQTRFETRIL